MRRRSMLRPLAYLALLSVVSCSDDAAVARRHARVAEMVASTVQIVVERRAGRQFGSGVVVARNVDNGRALILTAAHVLGAEDRRTISVVPPVGGARVAAELRAVDGTRDLALLEADIAGSPARVLSTTHLTDEIWVVGFPWGRARTVVAGAISQVRPAANAAPAVAGPAALIDAPVTYGMSGGGVFDRQDGRLIALVRGYRTADLSLEPDSEPLRIPIAGETTVISIDTIACFLRDYDPSMDAMSRSLRAATCTRAGHSD